MRMPRPHPIVCDRRGTAAVEFAFVLPFFIIILAGVWEVGRLVQATQIIQNAAREAARQASTGTVSLPTLKTNIQKYIQAADPPDHELHGVHINVCQFD